MGDRIECLMITKELEVLNKTLKKLVKVLTPDRMTHALGRAPMTSELQRFIDKELNDQD